MSMSVTASFKLLPALSLASGNTLQVLVAAEEEEAI